MNRMMRALQVAAGLFAGTLVAGAQGGAPHVAKGLDEWVQGVDHVVAVVYVPEAGGRRDPVIDGKLHPNVVGKFTKRLSKEQAGRLEGFVTGVHAGGGAAGCFYPHHGFIYYDKEGEVLGYLGICFGCGTFAAKPGDGLSELWDLNGIKKLAEELGLPVFDKEPDEWLAWFKEQRAGKKEPGGEEK